MIYIKIKLPAIIILYTTTIPYQTNKKTTEQPKISNYWCKLKISQIFMSDNKIMWKII